jgi:hypothetical protein
MKNIPKPQPSVEYEVEYLDHTKHPPITKTITKKFTIKGKITRADYDHITTELERTLLPILSAPVPFVGPVLLKKLSIAGLDISKKTPILKVTEKDRLQYLFSKAHHKILASICEKSPTIPDEMKKNEKQKDDMADKIIDTIFNMGL